MTKYYIEVDENGFVEGWSTTVFSEDVIEIETDINTDEFYYYRMTEDKELIYDDSKILQVLKEDKKNTVLRVVDMKRYSDLNITIDDVEYTWKASEMNRTFLEKSYELMSKVSLRDGVLFNMTDDNNQLVSLKLNSRNIQELWLLVFLRDEELNKKAVEVTDMIESIDNLDKLREFNVSDEFSQV